MPNKIVVLDDEEDVLAVVKTILTIYKYECYPIKQWEKLKATVSEINPDLILMDVRLVGKDGRALCNMLKSDSSSALIPIILFSSMKNIDTLCNDCNAIDYIRKPFYVKEFLQKISMYIPSPSVAVSVA